MEDRRGRGRGRGSIMGGRGIRVRGWNGSGVSGTGAFEGRGGIGDGDVGMRDVMNRFAYRYKYLLAVLVINCKLFLRNHQCIRSERLL